MSEPWQERLLVERNELAIRVEKLGKFLMPGDVDSLTAEEQSLLSKQYGHMVDYLAVLNARIKVYGLEEK